ncbi:transcription factor 7-like 1 isoform X5 [Nerophis ophidion]|uniref:transcription factor 7-like 1 isoform X5 n=1 Tax=Nerophis ophidion TaxID=159077 RepID=UPI002AE09FAD|nr:transcription factor 7-like 1 isoform X5 [Nerophis ophidion]
MCERTIGKYEEELCPTKEEKERQHQLLDAVFKKHQVVLHRPDAQQPPHIKEEEEDLQPPHIKEEDEDPHPPHIKEEEEEVSISQEEECLLGQEEADLSKFPLTVVSVKTEEHEDKPPESSQLHHSPNVQQPPHVKEEEEDPQPPHIKEEEEEVWISQEGECLLGQEEADVSKFPLTVVSVKTEEHEDKPPESSQLHHSPNQWSDEPRRTTPTQLIPTTFAAKDLIPELIDEDLSPKISPEIGPRRRFEDCIYHGEQIMAPFSHLAPPPQAVRPPMASVNHLVPPPQTVRPSMVPVNQLALPPPPPTVSCVPVVIQPEVMGQNPVGLMCSNSQLLFEMEPGEEPATFFTNPPPNSSKRKKRTGDNEDGPYIKKPPNAFMLFMKDQRPIVKAKFLNKDSATVNKALGQMWKSLTPLEQEKYFQKADGLDQIHANMYPQWSFRDNYGKKKRRKWRNPADVQQVSAESHEEIPSKQQEWSSIQCGTEGATGPLPH